VKFGENLGNIQIDIEKKKQVVVTLRDNSSKVFRFVLTEIVRHLAEHRFFFSQKKLAKQNDFILGQ
jgi:hypothetical protein